MSNEPKPTEAIPSLDNYDMTNVVVFDPDYKAKNSTDPMEINEQDPIKFAQLVSAQTGMPYKTMLVDLYNAIVESLDDVIDDPQVFMELLADADKLKEELIREGVLEYVR